MTTVERDAALPEPGPEFEYGIGEACPALGLVNDRSTRCLTSMAGHRCFALTVVRPIPARHQDAFCLSDAHRHCPIWQAAQSTTSTAVGSSPLQALSRSRWLNRARPRLRILAPAAALTLVLIALLAYGASRLDGHQHRSDAASDPGRAGVNRAAARAAASSLPIASTPVTAGAPGVSASTAQPSVTEVSPLAGLGAIRFS
ncbi:MAG: hypothetical protein ACYDCQ_22785 [Dehalococcoidia bacterium]